MTVRLWVYSLAYGTFKSVNFDFLEAIVCERTWYKWHDEFLNWEEVPGLTGERAICKWGLFMLWNCQTLKKRSVSGSSCSFIKVGIALVRAYAMDSKLMYGHFTTTKKEGIMWEASFVLGGYSSDEMKFPTR